MFETKKVVFNVCIWGMIAVLVYLIIPFGASPTEVATTYNILSAKEQGGYAQKEMFLKYEVGDSVSDSVVSGSAFDSTVADKEIQEILLLPEEGKDGFWYYVSEGEFETYKQARALTFSEKYESVDDVMDYWATLQETFVAKCWDERNGEKVTKNISVTCNKYVKNIFKAALEDIYNSSEQPIMSDIGFYRRSVTNGNWLSSHAMGLAVDINANYNPQYYSSAGKPTCGYVDAYDVKGAVVTKEMYDTKVVDDVVKSRTIYVGGAIVNVFTEKYTFRWGAAFNYRNSQGGGDRMHFSLGGDGSWRDPAIEYKSKGDWSEHYNAGIFK